MPLISVRPRDPQHLRRRVAEFHSIFDMLNRLEREALDLANAFNRAERWLDGQGADFHDLANTLKNMGGGATYQAKRLRRLSDQIEENWDLAMTLQKVCFDIDTDATPLEFGFPVDVIGKPPTDSEMEGRLDE